MDSMYIINIIYLLGKNEIFEEQLHKNCDGSFSKE